VDAGEAGGGGRSIFATCTSDQRVGTAGHYASGGQVYLPVGYEPDRTCRERPRRLPVEIVRQGGRREVPSGVPGGSSRWASRDELDADSTNQSPMRFVVKAVYLKERVTTARCWRTRRSMASGGGGGGGGGVIGAGGHL